MSTHLEKITHKERDATQQCNFRNLKSKRHTNRNRGDSNFKLQKLHSNILSNYALKLEKYYNDKFGQMVTPIALLKSLAVISSKFKKNVKLWILNVAPSRHLKTQTSQVQVEVFGDSMIVYAGSDFTIHGLIRDYDSGRKINNKCLLINDATLLLASKAKQTRARLIDALSELASEGRYIYSDFQHTYEIRARFSLIANITPHSFLVNRKLLLGNTFIERCLVVYHWLTDEEMSEANLKREERSRMTMERFRPKITEDEVEITHEDLVRFDEYAKRWRVIGGYSSSSSLFDMIRSIVVAYAILAEHSRVTRDEYRFLNLIEAYLSNPHESVKLKILELAHQGRSIPDICNILEKYYEKYRPFVSRVIGEYRRKGVLPPLVA